MENLFQLLIGFVDLTKVLLIMAFLLILIGAYANRQITHGVFWRAVAFLGVLIAIVLAVTSLVH